jgi:hypothetical protein
MAFILQWKDNKSSAKGIPELILNPLSNQGLRRITSFSSPFVYIELRKGQERV